MKKKGLTLIELLIVISLIGLIAAVIVSLYVTGFKTFREEMASSTVQSNGQTILDALTTDIKNGLQIEPAYDTYVSDADSIIIRIPAIDSSNNILYSGSDMLFDRIIYFYQDNSIHKIILADPSSSRYSKNGYDTILDTRILELQFAYEPDVATATLVTATVRSDIKVSGAITRSIILSGKARLRNHI